jgi:transcriptional/translational regulatory protein YebC/TACO1
MMRKRTILFPAVLLIFCLLSCISLAEVTETFMEEFYQELTNIIEGNMDNPERCVAEVERFYEKNQGRLSQFLEEAKRSGAHQDIAIKEQMDSMTEAEMQEAIERAQNSKLFQIMTRYSQAVVLFSRKYPEHGLKIMEKFRQAFPQTF